MTEPTSSGAGATPPSDPQPAMGNNASGGATPPPKPTTTLEEALARIVDLERHAQNKEQEAARHGKNLSAMEKELAAYKAAEQKAKDAQLSEVELTKKQHADLQSKYDSDINALTSRIAELEVKQIATRLGIIDPDAAVRLLDAEIEIDEEGNVTNAEALLKDLLKNKPYLAGTQSGRPAPASAGATNPSRATTNTASAESIVAAMRAGTLKTEEYARLDANTKREVQALISRRR